MTEASEEEQNVRYGNNYIQLIVYTLKWYGFKFYFVHGVAY